MKNYTELLQAILDGKVLEHKTNGEMISIKNLSSMSKYFPYPDSWQEFKEKTPELWYPKAVRLDCGMKSQGKYETPNGLPLSIVIHFTAGHNETPKHCENMLENVAKRGLGVPFGVAMNGTVYQTMPLDEWGYHAGDSFYEGIGHSVSRFMTGVEICNGGQLVNDKTWFGKKVLPENQRVIERPRYIGEQIGRYECFSGEQEESVIELVEWLKQNIGASFTHALGHDEVACTYGTKGNMSSIVRNKDGSVRRGRKNDPGGALSMGMNGLRAATGLKP